MENHSMVCMTYEIIKGSVLINITCSIRKREKTETNTKNRVMGKVYKNYR
jgi:hypothetical protein